MEKCQTLAPGSIQLLRWGTPPAHGQGSPQWRPAGASRWRSWWWTARNCSAGKPQTHTGPGSPGLCASDGFLPALNNHIKDSKAILGLEGVERVRCDFSCFSHLWIALARKCFVLGKGTWCIFGLILNWKGKLCISLSCGLALYTAPQFSQQAKTILDMYRDLINVERQKEVLPQPKAKCLYNRFSCEIFGTEILFIGNICDWRLWSLWTLDNENAQKCKH